MDNFLSLNIVKEREDITLFDDRVSTFFLVHGELIAENLEQLPPWVEVHIFNVNDCSIISLSKFYPKKKLIKRMLEERINSDELEQDIENLKVLQKDLNLESITFSEVRDLLLSNGLDFKNIKSYNNWFFHGDDLYTFFRMDSSLINIDNEKVIPKKMLKLINLKKEQEEFYISVNLCLVEDKFKMMEDLKIFDLSPDDLFERYTQYVFKNYLFKNILPNWSLHQSLVDFGSPFLSNFIPGSVGISDHSLSVMKVSKSECEKIIFKLIGMK
jgi:hypothetical protein